MKVASQVLVSLSEAVGCNWGRPETCHQSNYISTTQYLQSLIFKNIHKSQRHNHKVLNNNIKKHIKVKKIEMQGEFHLV